MRDNFILFLAIFLILSIPIIIEDLQRGKVDKSQWYLQENEDCVSRQDMEPQQLYEKYSP